MSSVYLKNVSQVLPYFVYYHEKSIVSAEKYSIKVKGNVTRHQAKTKNKKKQVKQW